MTETIISAVALVVTGGLLIYTIYLRVKNRQLFMKAAQSEVDRLSVYVQAQEVLKTNPEQLENRDGFIKFMSQSRDWAFEYIEKVQNDLYQLKDAFGDGSPKTVAQNNALAEAIRNTLSNLPEEGKK